MHHGGGDDLEDDFVPDDLVALSEEEDLDDIGEPLSADEDGDGGAGSQSDHVPSSSDMVFIAYILHTLSWTLSFVVSVGIALTGYAAEKGREWATGPRGYYPIHG